MKIALIGRGTWGIKIEKYIPKEELKYFVGSKFDKNIIWNDPEIDGVIIATPIKTHYQIARDALLHNKNVFIEKPITTTYQEAKELKDIAEKNNIKIGVDYTQTFSDSINMAQWLVKDIGQIEYIEMCSKQLGKFTENSVYQILASHHLSILNMFMDIEDLDFTFKDKIYNDYGICTTGSIEFQFGRIDVSLNYPGKEFYINIYGEKGTMKINLIDDPNIAVTLYNREDNKNSDLLIHTEDKYSLCEKNNIGKSINYFKSLINGKARSNIQMSLKVTKILEDV